MLQRKFAFFHPKSLIFLHFSTLNKGYFLHFSNQFFDNCTKI